MTEKSASKRMVTQCVYGPIDPQQVICELVGGGVPERYPDLHFAPDRVQRALAGLAGGRHGQVLGHRHRTGRRLVARPLGRRPSRGPPAPHGAALPPERKVAVPADAERVRAAPVPRLVPGRPGGRRLPATSAGCRPSCGATTTRTPRGRSGAAPAHRRAVRRGPRRRTGRHGRGHARRRCSASAPPRPPETHSPFDPAPAE